MKDGSWNARESALRSYFSLSACWDLLALSLCQSRYGVKTYLCLDGVVNCVCKAGGLGSGFGVSVCWNIPALS